MSQTRSIFTENFCWEFDNSQTRYYGPVIPNVLRYFVKYNFILGRWELVDNLGSVYDIEPGKTKREARKLIERADKAIFSQDDVS